MSYANQAALLADDAFQDRGSAAVFEQAEIFKDDGRGDIAALARLHLAAPNTIRPYWGAFLAAAPGFGDHTDSAAITDGDILAAVQADWPTVAAAHYKTDGTTA